MLNECLSAGVQTTPHLLDTLTLVEPQINVQKKPTRKQNNKYPQRESQKILEFKLEMSLNVTSAKWVGKASTNHNNPWEDRHMKEGLTYVSKKERIDIEDNL